MRRLGGITKWSAKSASRLTAAHAKRSPSAGSNRSRTHIARGVFLAARPYRNRTEVPLFGMIRPQILIGEPRERNYIRWSLISDDFLGLVAFDPLGSSVPS